MSNFSKSYKMIVDILNIFDKSGIELCTTTEILQHASPDNSFVIVNVNTLHMQCVWHKPSCSHVPELISGFGKFTENTFWIGMIMKSDKQKIKPGQNWTFKDCNKCKP